MNEIIPILIIKKYAVVMIAAMFGATAHALEEVKKVGWKGWFSFIIDIVVCSFVGYIFYHMTLLINPEYSVFATSIGSYWGTKGFKFAKDWFINSLKANLP